jgi:uncharacterized protein YqjF (DUF2071 family)
MAWLLSQRWDDMLFAHWPVEPQALRPLLPARVEPDVRDGRAWIGVVAFRMTETRAGGLLPPRGLGPIPELNVRTYVRVGGEAGVWFLSLDTSSPLFVTIGRTVYGLAYHHARMVVSRDGTRIHYASARGPAAFAASYEPAHARGVPARRGSLEHWLLERYRLFALRGGRLVTAEVAHPRWTLQPADARIELNTLEPRGICFRGDPLLQFSAGVDALISAPAQVGRAGLRAEPHRESARAPRAGAGREDAGELLSARRAAAVAR